MTALLTNNSIAGKLDLAASALAEMAGGTVESRSATQVAEHFRRAGLMDGDGGQRGPARPYEQIEALHACVRRAVDNTYTLRLCVGTDQDNIIESGPIAALLDKPNPQQSMRDLMADTRGWLLLSGRAYWHFTEMRGPAPVQMECVPGPMMREVFAGGPHKTTGKLVGYLRREPGQRWSEAQPVKLDEVWPLRLRSFDPENPHKGLAVADVVRRKINQLYKADTANELSLDNNMKFAGVISPEQPVSQDQWNDFADHLRAQYGGYRKRNQPLLVSRAVTVQSTQQSFSEMEFTELLDRSVAAICAAFGYDPIAVNFPAEGGIKSHVQAVHDAAWLNTDIPAAAYLADEFDRGVVSRFERDRSLTWRDTLRQMRTRRLRDSELFAPGHRRAISRRSQQDSSRLFVWFDDSEIPAVQRASAEFMRSVGELRTGLQVPVADLIRRFDLGLPIRPHHEVAWQTTSEMPISLGAPGDDDDTGDPELEQELPEDVDDPQLGVVALDVTEDQLRRLWESWRASWRSIESAVQRRVDSHYKRLRRESLRNAARELAGRSLSGQTFALPLKWIDEQGVARSKTFAIPVEYRDIIARLLFDLEHADRRLLAQLRPLARESVRLGGQQAMDEAALVRGDAQPGVFNLSNEEAVAAIRRRDHHITGINRRVAKRLRATIAEGMEKGEGLGEIQDRIRAKFNAENPKLVAFQETSTAVEESRQLGMKQAGVPLKSWLWSRKETGRPSHAATERATLANPVSASDDFTIAGTSIRCPHPRATGRAEHDINCGCTSIARYPGDSIKALIGGLLGRGFTTPDQLRSRFDCNNPQHPENTGGEHE